MINILDPRTVFIGGTLIDLIPEQIIDMIRAETLQHINARTSGIEIRALVDYKEFVMHGSLGLVLGQQYKLLQEDNLRSRGVARLRS